MLRGLILLSFFSIAMLFGQTQWTKDPTNPLISPGQVTGVWYGFDHFHAWMPTVIFDNGVYRMWYVGYGYTLALSYPEWMIGYAISEDGKNWFMYQKNPVLQPGSSFDNLYTWGGSVLKDGTQYKMYYGAYSSTAQKWSVGMATSPDGMSWTKLPNPVLTGGATGSWDANGVSTPCVIKEAEGQYKMWFGGNSPSTASIGYATSTDGINWTKYSGNPILSAISSHQWESSLVFDPRVVKVGPTYHMFYTGTPSAGQYQIGYASSSDGINWLRYAGNPVLGLGQSGSWESSCLSMHWVVWKDSTFKMWYAGRDNAYQVWQIGYATAPLGPTAVKPTEQIPNSFRLQQNYPNPFNPSTTIEYDVPSRTHITLKIYNTLGQEIATLVNEERMPGSYTVLWNGDGAASGTYLSCMTADGRSVTQKMLLIK